MCALFIFAWKAKSRSGIQTVFIGSNHIDIGLPKQFQVKWHSILDWSRHNLWLFQKPLSTNRHSIPLDLFAWLYSVFALSCAYLCSSRFRMNFCFRGTCTFRSSHRFVAYLPFECYSLQSFRWIKMKRKKTEKAFRSQVSRQTTHEKSARTTQNWNIFLHNEHILVAAHPPCTGPKNQIYADESEWL